ncbi:helix-turn-helix transcriptional regulator [Spirochaeta dissipatitropha]
MYQNLIQIISAAKLMARPEGAEISELEEELGISRRSVYRLLNTLERLGYPYYNANENIAHKVRYKLISDEHSIRWSMPKPDARLTVEERILLQYLFTSSHAMPGMEALTASLQRKIAMWAADAGAILFESDSTDSEPGRTNADGQTHSKRLPLSLFPSSRKQRSETTNEMGSILISAIRNGRELMCSYQRAHASEARSYPIHPITLFESNGGSYVRVLFPKYGDFRTLAVERIQQLEETGVVFQPYEGGELPDDPFALVVGEPTDIHLRISPQYAFFVRERVWPKSYRITELSDGGMEMQFRSIGPFQVRQWVLSQPNDIELLQPEHMRQEIADAHRAGAERHS